MIGRISGRLEELNEAAALLDVGGGLWYEVYVPACDVDPLARRVGQDIVLYTIHYFEGDPAHGQLAPRLIGFSRQTDRDFFRLFTTVKGIGVRKALRAMVRPVAEVATAIQNKDTKLLQTLPGIGRRAAETILAELTGRVDDFAGPAVPVAASPLPQPAEEALAVLIQLGERRSDATALIERVLAVAPELNAPEAILQHAYRFKAGGS